MLESLAICATSVSKASKKKNPTTKDEASLHVWLFAWENSLLFESHFAQSLKHICEGYYKEHELKCTLLWLLKLYIVARERLLITFRNNLIFSGLED